MNFKNKWLRDLEDGQKGEKVIATILSKKLGKEIDHFNNDYRYDFILNDIKWEVKTDCWEHYKGRITGNIFIEYQCGMNPSGILTTEAKWFVYYFPYLEEAFFIKVKNLKELLNNKELRHIESAGDGGKVKGFLINRNTFRDHFKVLKIKRDIKLWK